MSSTHSMDPTDLGSIGGHFAAFVGSQKYAQPGIHSYESARSGLYAVIKSTSTRRIFIPNYICSDIFDVLNIIGINYIKCPISNDFRISIPVDFQSGDLVILVDYFGLTERIILDQLKDMPSDSVVVDCSQAYFQQPFACLATLYSPRKFLPLPDGGFVASELPLASEPADEVASIDRYRYLLERTAAEPEFSRQGYLDAEASLRVPRLRAMSRFSRVIAETVDQSFIRKRRRANFEYLQFLDNRNELSVRLGDQVPLCYPFMHPRAADIKKMLLQKRIFLPTFWSDVSPLNGFERKLVSETLFIPIDHRYTDADMARVLHEIDRAAGGWA